MRLFRYWSNIDSMVNEAGCYRSPYMRILRNTFGTYVNFRVVFLYSSTVIPDFFAILISGY